MLSVQEQEYIKSLIDTYFKAGYKYYLLVSRRTTYSSDDYEYFLYMSRADISGYNSNLFNVVSGILLKIDTSAKNNNNFDDNLVVEEFSGVVQVDVSEFVYTNSEVDYDLTQESLNPDLFLGGDVNFETNIYSSSVMFVFVCAVICAFLFKLFRG